jgi:pimeloyl-ACP methyl ester carboxylesterase
MRNSRSLRWVLALALLLSCQAGVSGPESTREQASDRDVVVLLHGLGRNNMAMWLLAQRLEDAGFHVERIGYGSLNASPREILEEVSSQIDDCCSSHCKTVHYVGHSLGGLLIRAYLQERRPDNLGRVALMGTPNQGTPIVDRFRDHWWMKLLGPTTNALGTDGESFPSSLEPPWYPVGVIAGVAKWGYNEPWLPGADDGLVTVEATKLEGMSDFIVIRTGHAFMRYDPEVARQAIRFLNEGSFAREQQTDPTHPAVQAH